MAGLFGFGLVSPPSSLPKADEFGIPYLSATILLTETDEDRVKRETAARRLILRVFQAAVTHLGDVEARRVWAAAAKKKRGARKGSRNPERDRILLQLYDAVVTEHGGSALDSLPRKLAAFAYRVDSKKFGSSSEAIEKHVRRLVARREQQKAAERERVAKFLMYGDFPSRFPGTALLLGLPDSADAVDKKPAGLLSGGHEIDEK